MKKTTIALIAILSAACPIFAQSKATLGIYGVKALPALEQKLKAEGTISTLDRVRQSMDANFIDAMASTRKFDVVARSDWESVLREQDFGQSGSVDQASAARLGKALGAKFILETTITDFQDYVETANFPSLGKTAQKRILRFGAVAKLYDSSTGKLAESANITVDGSDVAEIASYSVRNGNLNDELVAKIAKAMAKKIAARISDVAFPPKVISLIGNQIIINRGDGTGISVGDKYKIMATGERMVDPDTGEDLGFAEADVGVAEITEVLPKFSKGVLSENFGVEKGHIARKIAPASPSGGRVDGDSGGER